MEETRGLLRFELAAQRTSLACIPDELGHEIDLWLERSIEVAGAGLGQSVGEARQSTRHRPSRSGEVEQPVDVRPQTLDRVGLCLNAFTKSGNDLAADYRLLDGDEQV